MTDIPGAARAYLKNILLIVEEQSDDPGLWFDAETAPEQYVQKALRRLHAAIEDEPWAKEIFKR